MQGSQKIFAAQRFFGKRRRGRRRRGDDVRHPPHDAPCGDAATPSVSLRPTAPSTPPQKNTTSFFGDPGGGAKENDEYPAPTRRQRKKGSLGIYSLSHDTGASFGCRDSFSRGRDRARSGNGAHYAPFPSSQAAKSPPGSLQESACSPLRKAPKVRNPQN